ncbi:MAG: indole-3-glycerol-phosphate synthase [Deltaproteobacteria bacterium]|nr:indole-3-glycerol-phosphate synthase [Deltaproteobacteria bacterium]
MPLSRFVQAKAGELRRLEQMAGSMQPLQEVRPSFSGALEAGRNRDGIAVIAEYKRRSPSAGVLCEALAPDEVARQYAVAGASCMSVLTEEQYFGGSLGDLSQASEGVQAAAKGGHVLPILRKDFLFHPLQVLATACTRASALLLIVRQTPESGLLRSLREQAESFGLDAVVEVFDENDLRLARESGARIIQVNARDLKTFKVDRNACLELVRHNPPLAGEIWIAASGMDRAEHVLSARESGFSAALIGSALMRGGHPGEKLAELLGGIRKPGGEAKSCC